MRKEVILAVIIGIILGGVILYGINLANQSVSPKGDTETQINNQDSDKTNPGTSKNSESISIVYPQNNAVITETSLTLKGSTKPNAHVAIITENDDIITLADANGSFSSPITLIGGENLITVTAVDSTQATSSASITVIQTTSLP